jgi:hypothetical protein
MTLMKELHTIFPVHINKPNFFCKVHEDNQSTIKMATSDKFTLQTKHIALQYHQFCSQIKNGHLLKLAIVCHRPLINVPYKHTFGAPDQGLTPDV